MSEGSARFRLQVPRGDDRPRAVCDHCGFVAYVNPKVVVGAVCTHEDRILLCRRDIEPRRGFWTVPAGFLEESETTEQGAAREAREEACAEIEITALLGIYNIAHISQVYILYKAELRSPDVRAGDETSEVRLFRHDEIPWGELAFDSVEWALRRFPEVRDRDRFPPFRHPE